MNRKLLLLFVGIAVLFAMAACSSSNNPSTAQKAAGTEQAVADAVDAYIYGYPLVTMDMTRRQFTNVAAPDAAHAPMGQMLKVRTYPPVDVHTVTAPNRDTLYTMAWIDVSSEPWVLGVPDMGDRYYLLPMLSGWTDVVQVPGSALPAARPRPTRSPAPAGAERCPRV